MLVISEQRYSLSAPVWISNTDDRCPTFYFKVKIHKAAFQSSLTESSKYPEVYQYSLHKDNMDMFVAISRPVVNHEGCITTLCTPFLQGPLERVISKCRYLTKDIFESIERLRETIPRKLHLLHQPCMVVNTSSNP